MGHPGEHLPHGRQLLGLDELLFQALELGDVPRGNDHPVDLPALVGERAEMAAHAPPIALLVLHANLEGGEGLLAGHHLAEQRVQGGVVLRMRLDTQLALLEIIRLVA